MVSIFVLHFGVAHYWVDCNVACICCGSDELCKISIVVRYTVCKALSRSWCEWSKVAQGSSELMILGDNLQHVAAIGDTSR